MAKNKGGQPTVMTESKVKELEDAFSWGCTDLEACCYANISKQTLYNYCHANPEFFDRKEVLKNNPTLKAKRIILNALHGDDINTAHKVIDRKEGTKVKAELTGKDGGAIETKATFNFIPVGADD